MKCIHEFMSNHGCEDFSLICLSISSMKADTLCWKVEVKGTFYIERGRVLESVQLLAVDLPLK